MDNETLKEFGKTLESIKEEAEEEDLPGLDLALFALYGELGFDMGEGDEEDFEEASEEEVRKAEEE